MSLRRRASLWGAKTDAGVPLRVYKRIDIRHIPYVYTYSCNETSICRGMARSLLRKVYVRAPLCFCARGLTQIREIGCPHTGVPMRHYVHVHTCVTLLYMGEGVHTQSYTGRDVLSVSLYTESHLGRSRTFKGNGELGRSPPSMAIHPSLIHTTQSQWSFVVVIRGGCPWGPGTIYPSREDLDKRAELAIMDCS